MRIPVATYRVQFNKDFRFSDATALVPQLHRLGVSHLYASPIFAARPGSGHGYDVVDPNRLNPEIGGEEEFEALLKALRERGMGIVLDIVPNHMAASPDNRWWMDVLENGPSSPFASYFGIDWDPRHDKIFLPILGDHYGTVLERGELKISYEERGFFLNYYQHKLPIAPVTYASLLKPGSEPLLQIPEYSSWLEALERLPPRNAMDWDALQRRYSEKDPIKQRLWALVQQDEAVRSHVFGNLEAINGITPDSIDWLDQVIQEQAYRIAYWRAATERINYRRFFDVSDLVGVRVEDRAVFEAGHKLVLEMARQERIDGLRIDHIDGLSGPLQYARQLPSDRIYIIAEKILSGTEELPPEWPLHGTTGYDFLGYANSLFIEPLGFDRLATAYQPIIGTPTTFADVAYQRKILIISTLFSGEMQGLGMELASFAQEDRNARDLSLREIMQAFIEVTASMPVYRTYSDSLAIRPTDKEYIQQACAAARVRADTLNALTFDFVERVLTLQFRRWMPDASREAWLDFVGRWQQISGPIMAKGVEDSAMYVYNPLVSLNEVGGIHRPVGAEEFHDFVARRQRRWPNTMNASSTHDTKRSEDVRARINVLSEIPDEWLRLTSRWSRWLAGSRGEVDRNEEYFLFQTLVGAWPLDPAETDSFRERLKRYVVKAGREARTYTSWVKHDERHEKELEQFVDVLFDNQQFQASFQPFLAKVAYYGAINSLSQLLLKATAPGLPDFYRGTISWDFSLVDPDNRRPVEFAPLTDFSAKAKDLLATWRDGRVKIFLTEKLLAYRTGHHELFERGEYVPLTTTGKRAENVFAFARRLEGTYAIVLIPRFSTQLSVMTRPPVGIRAWFDTTIALPEGMPSLWRNVITGTALTIRNAEIPVYRALEQFPVALLRSR